MAEPRRPQVKAGRGLQGSVGDGDGDRDIRSETRTQVSAISDLGLVEMTRKRIGEGLLESVSHMCEQCDGRGVQLKEELLDV